MLWLPHFHLSPGHHFLLSLLIHLASTLFGWDSLGVLAVSSEHPWPGAALFSLASTVRGFYECRLPRPHLSRSLQHLRKKNNIINM